MKNEEYIKNYWKYTRNELKTFNRRYKTLNERTQDKLQDLFNSLHITARDLNRTVPNSLKEKLMRKIEEWKENKVYKGFFEYKTRQLLKGNITYRSYVEIMIYGSYIEEMSKIDELATAMFRNISNEYIRRGREELRLPPRRFDILPELLVLLINGLTWYNYLDGLYLSNAEQIEKEYIIQLQAGKDIDINSEAMQRVFRKQRNYLINIKVKPTEKYSGGLDEYASAYTNEAYLRASEKNQKVMFISDLCDNVTSMCKYMDGMIFNTKDKNVFKRPYGRTAKELKVVKITTKGLVPGINMPPINYHFHWCHSTFTYLTDKEIIEDARIKLRERRYAKLSDIEQYNRYIDILGKEKTGTFDNFMEIKYNKDVSEWNKLKEEFRKVNTVITGARNNNRIKTIETKEKHANIFYEEVRKRQGDSERISKNTEWSKEQIEEIREYLFVNEHDLGGDIKRFDADYEIAVSWQRLNDGQDIRPQDLLLLKHENYEIELIKQGLSQQEAHILASKKYNYAKEVEKYNDRGKES